MLKVDAAQHGDQQRFCTRLQERFLPHQTKSQSKGDLKAQLLSTGRDREEKHAKQYSP